MIRDTVYEVARPSGLCSATGRPIAPGEAFMAALLEREGEDRLERRDYTVDAWAAAAGGLGGRVVASWRAVMPRSEERGRRLIDDDALADLFEQVSTPGVGESAARGAFRYLLALLLIRRRILRHAGARPGALLVRWARDGGDAPPVEVTDPGIDKATIAAATEQLSGVILGGSSASESAER